MSPTVFEPLILAREKSELGPRPLGHWNRLIRTQNSSQSSGCTDSHPRIVGVSYPEHKARISGRNSSTYFLTESNKNV
jgi:hypothetical protein